MNEFRYITGHLPAYIIPFARFKGPGSPPPPPDPAPIPEVDEGVQSTEMARIRRKSGYAKTILTGELTPDMQGKKDTLG